MIFVFLWALLSLFFLCGALVERYYLSPSIDLTDHEFGRDGYWIDKVDIFDYARSCGMTNCQGACGICEATS